MINSSTLNFTHGYTRSDGIVKWVFTVKVTHEDLQCAIKSLNERKNFLIEAGLEAKGLRYHEYDQKWVPIDYSNELTLDEELEDYGDTYFEQYILNGPYEMTESIDMNSVDSIDEAIHSLQSVVAILDKLVTG